jgi:metal-responsive CopG/Arc/MetJ family transcriptional regulator
MKRAISLPNDLVVSADELARNLGMSRNGLFAEALAEYIAKYRSMWVTERLNEVFSSKKSVLDSDIRANQRRTLERTQW